MFKKKGIGGYFFNIVIYWVGQKARLDFPGGCYGQNQKKTFWPSQYNNSILASDC